MQAILTRHVMSKRERVRECRVVETDGTCTCYKNLWVMCFFYTL